MSKIYFLGTYAGQIKIQQRLEDLLQAQFYKCSFHYFQKFSPIFVRFMNYLKYITKHLKHNQTLVLIIIIIIIITIIIIIIILIYQVDVVPKVSLFVAPDVVPNVYNKPWIYGGYYYLPMRLFKFETLDEV